jgi:hypothetical protein
MSTSSKLAAPVPATTIHGRAVVLDAGVELLLEPQRIRECVARLRPDQGRMEILCRCPGARNFAPYRVDVAELLRALPA